MQDTPGVPAKDATVTKAFNFVRIIEELQSIDISEPIVPAVQSLQAWEWALKLLMEILTDHKRAAVGIKDEMTKLFFNLGARHASLHNHGMSCRLIQTSVTIDTGYVPGLIGDDEEFISMDGKLREFESTRFAVPLLDPQVLDSRGIEPFCHSATMTGAAIDTEEWTLDGTLSIMNIGGIAAFVTLHYLEEAEEEGMYPVQLWRFISKTPRGAAKQKSGIERLSSACTQFQYDVGALHDNKVWLTCFDYPYNMAVNFDADRQIEVYAPPERWASGDLAKRKGVSVVAWGGQLIAYGGYTYEDKLLALFSEVSVMDMRERIAWVRQEIDGPVPPLRHDHCAWMVGHFMYVFGGVGSESFAEARMFQRSKPGRLTTLNDLWRLDTCAWTWEELHPIGIRPCPRSHAGLAVNGERTYIVGGKAHPTARLKPDGSDGKKQLLLADIFQYHVEENCWLQVLPAVGQRAWMSARHSPACGVLENGNLAVLGGFNAADPICFDACLKFDVKQADVAECVRLMTPKEGADVPAAVVPELSAPEPWPRLGVDLDAASPRLRAFLTAPLGACTFFTHHHEELCQHVLGPGDSITTTGGMRSDYVPYVMGPGFIFCKSRAKVLPSEGLDMPWKVECSPFDTVPRWLTFPCEAVFNMEAKRNTAATVVDALTQIIKFFGTQKAAREYFRASQPQLDGDNNGWLCMDMKNNMKTSLAERVAYGAPPLTEEGYILMKGPRFRGKAHQLLLTAVMGHAYGAFLVTVSPKWAQSADSDQEVRPTACFVAWMHCMLERANARGAVVHCIQCGASEHLKPGDEQAKTVKVCRGCRLVRYCSKECQAAAWPQHKAICRKFKDQ